MKFERDSASRRVNAPESVYGANRAFAMHATLRLRVVTPENSWRLAIRLTDLERFFRLNVYRSRPCGSRSTTPSRNYFSMPVLALKPFARQP